MQKTVNIKVKTGLIYTYNLRPDFYYPKSYHFFYIIISKMQILKSIARKSQSKEPKANKLKPVFYLPK